MALMNESRRGAMKIEEAALLPALPRHMSGQAALESVLLSARRMVDKQVGNAIMTAQSALEMPLKAIAVSYHKACSRAALHHILKR